ncbi:tRNA-uridine aminocarboxypropyltransferase [Marinobacter sp. F4216]|uniref:tRNA-uridine aminocarboxypropyltransferase n=1 Tax=Marinobacter sp. F4216 TaxID=2874281 RepID=UPI001CBAB2D0|nr:tRNA-uridine aminocarboxypropyltransferase [Marinobacter sp. F4216]MBZ2169758.1 DTW domain-containing protein [Marinobacter sp. F4216]
MPRDLCPHCNLHLNICVCAHCRPVANRTPITILQHPTEVDRPKGTVRILQRCLDRLRVLVGETPDQFRRGGFDPTTLSDTTALLFPGPRSQPVEHADLAAISHWVVLDGTWRKAARILHTNPGLQALPAFHFQQAPPSRYIVRKAPGPDALSTAEAVSHLLDIVEPGTDTGPISDAMTALIEKQLAQIPDHLRHHYPTR